MPEQLTKHPEVTLQVLRSSGARCGEGEPQQILVQCPVERFCKLPGGEICVYGLPDAASMTQLKVADWQSLAPLTVAAAPTAPPPTPSISIGEALPVAGVALLVGLVVGFVVSRMFGRSR